MTFGMVDQLDKIFKKLANKQAVIGTWLQISSTDVAEIIGGAGYDWAALDLEHGHFSRSELKDMFRALSLSGTVPMARVACCEAVAIKEALDAGAMGIILPMIESAEQLKNGVAWAHYPPKGTRGIGFSRANMFGRDFDAYRRVFSSNVFIAAQIESINAVKHLDEILTVDGLDAVMVGPYDLSGSMGVTGQFDHPEFIKAMDLITAKARAHRVSMGAHVVEPDIEVLKQRLDQGYQFIAYGVDAFFLHTSSENPVRNKG